MEGVIAATGATVDNGHGALSGKILWQEVRILGYVIFKRREYAMSRSADRSAGWAKFMTWKYPVDVVISSPQTFKLAGAIEAAATI